jgi:hypothetical protein
VIYRGIAMLSLVAVVFLATPETIESQNCAGWFDHVALVCDSTGD